MIRPEVSLPNAAWHFPKPEAHTLPNALQVWHFPMPNQPVIAFELTQPIRLTEERRELEGVGTIALHALDESTVRHPNVQELLDAHGVSLHASTSMYATRIGGLVPARRFHAFLPLLAEILTQPAYRDEDVALHIEAQTAAFRTRLSTPASVARWAIRAGLYGADQRWGRPAGGSPETLSALTRDDVMAWHTAQFAPAGSTLAIAGDLPDVAVSVLECWQGRRTPTPIAQPDLQPAQTLIVDLPQSQQATIQVARRSISRAHPQWAAARLAGHVVAGGFASRLNLELREQLGYTYGIGGGFFPDPTGSVLHVQTSTRTEVAGDALRRILDAWRLTTPISDSELADAKAFCVGVAPLANETSADITSQAIALAEAGLPATFVDRHIDALRDVTAEQATAAWRELVDPDAAVIAIAGDAETLVPQLADYNPVVVDLASL